MQVLTRAWADISLRDVTIAEDRVTEGDRVQMMSRTRSMQRFLGIWRKLRELKLDAEQGGSTFGARWGEMNLHAMGAAQERGQMKKST